MAATSKDLSKAATKTEPTDNNDADDNGDGFTKMTPQQKRMFELRLKLNECRKRNHQEVVAEDKRAHDESEGGSRRQEAQKRWENRDNTNNKERGEKKTIEEVITADVADQKDKRNKNKRNKKETFGWSMYTDESHYNSYHRRTKELEGVSKQEYGEQKATMTQEELFKSVDDLSYGQAPKVSKEGINRMVAELEKAEERKNKFSRRRAENPDADVNYINDRNKIFNKKIARAFDPYTAEIRQNLERGTAL